MEKSKFHYLEDIATADAAFEAFGATLPELFTNAALATMNVMAPLDLVKPLYEHDVKLEADSIEDLMFNWLAELIYLKDANSELYSHFEITIIGDGNWQLQARVQGNSIDTVRLHTQTDVKAVTYHRLSVESNEDGYKATVVLDL